MTWFGKILVLCNLAFSVGLASWALIFYTTRIDWSDNPAKDNQPAGELVKRIEDAKAGWNGIPRAERDWVAVRAKLAAMEEGSTRLVLDQKEYKINGRRANRQWYADEMQHLRTGANADKPCQMLVFDELRRLTFADADPLTPRPRMVPAADRDGKPLLSLAAYIDQEKTVLAELDKEQLRLQAAIEEDIRLTLLITGDKEKGTKGLYARLLDEWAKKDDIMTEHGLVKYPLINTYVESELLLKRKRAWKYGCKN